MKLRISVKPSSRINELLNDGEAGLKVKITAPPEDGKANLALIALLADYLHLPKSKITLLQGHSSKIKLIEIDAQDAEILNKLSTLKSSKKKGT